jgi:hypothetical protein
MDSSKASRSLRDATALPPQPELTHAVLFQFQRWQNDPDAEGNEFAHIAAVKMEAVQCSAELLKGRCGEGLFGVGSLGCLALGALGNGSAKRRWSQRSYAHI